MPLHIGNGGKSISGSASKVGGLSSSASKVGGLSGSASKVRVGVCSSGDVFGAAAVNAVKGDGEAGKGERGEGEDSVGAKNAMMMTTILLLLPSSPPPKCNNQSTMTNWEDAAGD